jgi:hypothetical protein
MRRDVSGLRKDALGKGLLLLKVCRIPGMWARHRRHSTFRRISRRNRVGRITASREEAKLNAPSRLGGFGPASLMRVAIGW